MQQYKTLCALFSTCALFFYSFTMEKEFPSNRDIIISLIHIIRTQQGILNYKPSSSTETLCIPEYFQSAFEQIANIDPKEELEQAKSYEKIIQDEAIPCINEIIYQHDLLGNQTDLIIKIFGTNSLSLLRKTIEHNEIILKKQQLFGIYQYMRGEQPKPPQPQQPTTTTSPIKSKRTQQSREIMEQLTEIKPLKKAIKDNEIQFTQATYEKLTYNYQGYKYWIDKGLECNIHDPFINVEISTFDEDGNRIFNNPNMPLPLPILLDDNGNVKSEISLPLSPRPFTVNYKNTEPLQNVLPKMAINFYKNIGAISENDEEYLLNAHVIQKQDDKYIHGTNSCKPLLEKYFRDWGISEDQYKQVQEPVVQSQQPEEKKEGWITTIWNTTKRFFGKVNRFFENIYYSLLYMRTALFGEPPVRKSSTEKRRAVELRKIDEKEEH